MNPMATRASSASRESTYDPACPICESAFSAWRIKASEGHAYSIVRCDGCRYAFVNPRPSLAFLRELYAVQGHGAAPMTFEQVMSQEREDPNSTLDADRIVRKIRSLSPPQGPFLDVGCGYGFFSRAAQANGFNVVAIELASGERATARAMTGVEPIAETFEDVSLEPGSMSVVLMSQILEHAYDVNLWVRKAYELLCSGGIAAIALPNFGSLQRLVLNEREPYICPPEHLNFFSPRSLSRLLAKHGFEILAIESVSRIPARTISRRLPRPVRASAPIFGALGRITCKALDAVRLGMMINVYARKPR